MAHRFMGRLKLIREHLGIIIVLLLCLLLFLHWYMNRP